VRIVQALRLGSQRLCHSRQSGLNLRQVTYTPNLLNQSTQHHVSDGLDIMGYAPAASTVTVNNAAVYRLIDCLQKLSGSHVGGQGAGGIGGLLFVWDAVNDSAGSKHYHAAYDGNGNLVRLGDTAGNEIAAYEYGPFGELLESRGASGGNPFRFSTKYADAETGLYYYGYRYYNASTGRWLSRDPIEEQGGANLYAFIENEPLHSVDYLGLRAIDVGFNAFINGTRRGRILSEPFPMGTSGLQYAFSTDLRDFGQFNARTGNARLYSLGSIESTDIGSFGTRPPFGLTAAGISSEYRRRTDLLQFQWEFVRSSPAIVSKARITFGDHNKCASWIHFESAGKYPFGPLGSSWFVPAINYEVTFQFMVERDGYVTIVASGGHDKFPDFEAYGVGSLIYTYFSESSGPGIWSVGLAPRRWFRGAKHGITVQADTPSDCECDW
jgi:RHS repeat-associated protein